MENIKFVIILTSLVVICVWLVVNIKKTYKEIKNYKNSVIEELIKDLEYSVNNISTLIDKLNSLDIVSEDINKINKTNLFLKKALFDYKVIGNNIIEILDLNSVIHLENEVDLGSYNDTDCEELRKLIITTRELISISKELKVKGELGDIHHE